MRKRLRFIHREDGFIFPFVLFVASIALIILTTSIHVYENNADLTERHIQQLKNETLYQMAIHRFKEERKPDGEFPVVKNYRFPDGSARVSSLRDDDKQTYKLKVDMELEDSEYTMYHYLPLLTDDE